MLLTNLMMTFTLRLVQPRLSPSTKFRDLAFSTAVSKVWNSLPDDIQKAGTTESFKQMVEKALFLL